MYEIIALVYNIGQFQTEVFMRITVTIMALAFMLSIHGVALADDENTQNETLAIDKGNAPFYVKKYADKADFLRRSYQTNPAWQILFDIGWNEAAAKRYGLALEAFTDYLSKGGSRIPDDKLSKVIARVDELRGEVGSVVVDAQDGAQIFIDGVRRGQAPLLGLVPVAADVDHTIYVVLDREPQEEQVFKVGRGEAVTVEFARSESEVPAQAETIAEPESEQEPETIEIEDKKEKMSSLKTAGWVTLGLGGAMLIGSIVTGGMALSIDGDLKESCPQGHCPAGKKEDVDRLRPLAVSADILLGVGAATAAAGAIILLISAGDKEGKQDNVALVPFLGSGVAGGSIQGSF